MKVVILTTPERYLSDPSGADVIWERLLDASIALENVHMELHMELGAWAFWENSAPNSRGRLTRSRFPRLQWHCMHLRIRCNCTYTYKTPIIDGWDNRRFPNLFACRCQHVWYTFSRKTGGQPMKQEYRYPTTDVTITHTSMLSDPDPSWTFVYFSGHIRSQTTEYTKLPQI